MVFHSRVPTLYLRKDYTDFFSFPFFLQPYATTFPIVSVDDMVYSFFLLLDSLGIEKVWMCLFNKNTLLSTL